MLAGYGFTHHALRLKLLTPLRPHGWEMRRRGATAAKQQQQLRLRQIHAILRKMILDIKVSRRHVAVCYFFIAALLDAHIFGS